MKRLWWVALLALAACGSPTAPVWECGQAFVLDTLATAGDTTAWLLTVEECHR
jgi:hypothetical protein